MADKVYCSRDNQAVLKRLEIKLKAKPLGRPAAVANHVCPGERNLIEGKFGQAKTAYGLNRVKARLQKTSESWIASIIIVLNLIKLAGKALLCFFLKKTHGLKASKLGYFLALTACVYNINDILGKLILKTQSIAQLQTPAE